MDLPITSDEIRRRYLAFFEKRGHTVVSSSSLVTNDPSVLFTTAGMQQFKPYYLGEPSPYGQNAVSVQKCVRTSDIDEVGDDTHLTFFEMLGNFSFGGYWKKEAIEYAHEFITKELGLKIDYVSIFKDDSTDIPADEESRSIWQSLDSNLVIKEHDAKDNFWGPTGTEGPCGPTTEIYINGVEIWNIVFNEYYKTKEGKYEPLEIKGIDTGMGLERLLVQVQKAKNVYETDVLETITNAIESNDIKAKRIIADHIRTAVFMISDGVVPTNTDRGYVLRRLIRRARYYLNSIGASDKALGWLAYVVADIYQNTEYNLKQRIKDIDQVITLEETTFAAHLEFGKKLVEKIIKTNGKISGENAFLLYSTYGFPFELVKEIAIENKIEVDEADFKKRKSAHQDLSRSGAEQKFKGGLAGHSEVEVKYHTATHLLHQALHDVLGDEVGQKGSNITPERLRFDFSFSRKMTDEEKMKVEDIVNEKIKSALPVQKVIMPKAEAEKTGARHFFGEKYPDEVSIYYIGDSLDTAYSKEFCGGPHVSNTSELGHFKIRKEEAVSAGVRRIKAILE
jgi:alanyl-tRNA synthetase